VLKNTRGSLNSQTISLHGFLEEKSDNKTCLPPQKYLGSSSILFFLQLWYSQTLVVPVDVESLRTSSR
jgi:hypothetical protein